MADMKLDPKRQEVARQTRDDYLRRAEYHESEARSLRAIAESLTHRWQLGAASVTNRTHEDEKT
jgi:hypothetical protein